MSLPVSCKMTRALRRTGIGNQRASASARLQYAKNRIAGMGEDEAWSAAFADELANNQRFGPGSMQGAANKPPGDFSGMFADLQNMTFAGEPGKGGGGGGAGASGVVPGAPPLWQQPGSANLNIGALASEGANIASALGGVVRTAIPTAPPGVNVDVNAPMQVIQNPGGLDENRINEITRRHIATFRLNLAREITGYGS